MIATFIERLRRVVVYYHDSNEAAMAMMLLLEARTAERGFACGWRLLNRGPQEIQR
jgi:hypothetical protein